MNNKSIARIIALVLIAVSVAGCGLLVSTFSDQPPRKDMKPVEDYQSFVDLLNAGSIEITELDEVEQPFFEVPAKIISVNGEPAIQVFEFADEAATSKAASLISPDGSSIGTSTMMWLQPAHFYSAGNLVVLYLGTNEAVLDALERILGSQIAGQ